MATKSKLEQAIERQARDLPEAQRELVLSQFSTYKWNKRRMDELQDQLKLMDRQPPPADPAAYKTFVQHRKAITSERTQLSNANNSISSKLFMQLKDTGGEVDEFEKFLHQND